MEIIILIGIIVVTYYLGKYAIEEGQRIESQKEFEKNLKKWDKKSKTK